MRLKYQLFASLLLVSAILIALMYLLNSWSFNRGFLAYLNSIEAQKLSSIVDDLGNEYRNALGWENLLSDEERWRSLNQEFSARGSTRDADRRKPDGNRTDGNRRGGREGQSELSTEARRPPPPGRNSRLPPRRPRLFLADAAKQTLIGPGQLPAKVVWRPIIVDDITVGFVGASLRDSLSDELDKVFAAQQSRSYAYAALAMVLVSALLAILMSSRLVKPIVRIQRAVSDISGGNFSHRVDADRRDELGELGRDVNQLAFTLEENLAARQQWFVEISHELRTPVAVLQAEIEALQDGIKDVDASAIASLHGETLRLSYLINDLHELSSMDAGSLNYHMLELDLNKLLQSRLSAGQHRLEDKKISVRYSSAADSMRIVGDEQRLGQLFDNLLQNSVRYTNSGGELEVSLSAEAGYLNVVWEDSAPGVLDEQLPHLFESLYRTEESRSRETGGSGLGLSIAMKIANAHQGEIEAGHSTLGGLCITLRLPLAGGFG